MSDLPKIIDNNRSVFLDIFKDISSDHNELSIATGYWDLPVMQLVLDHIKDYKKIRILIGREPILKRDNNENIATPEPDYPDEDFFDDLKKINPTEELKNTTLRIKELIESDQLEVRVYRRDFLHAKCYIFGGYDSAKAIGVIGSSNFTKNGLTTNTELNALENDHRLVTYKPSSSTQEVGHLAWFDEMWADEMTEEWSGQFLEMIRTSHHGDLLFSPKEMYIRTLYELYREEIELEKEDIIHPHSKTLYDFQERNVKNLQRILEKNGVAMLADSVGLGKTISAIGVIKQYQNTRVVVIAPKSLMSHWRQELAKEGLHNVKIISLQNKQDVIDQQEIDQYSPVNLFVIDESHNLRSSNGSRYERLSEWIANKHNEEARVLLVTATPINNSLEDLTNQILLGARGEQDIFTLAVRNSEGSMVNRSFYEAVDNIRKRIQQNISQGKEDLSEVYKDARNTLDPIIRNFVVRNTRQSIKQIKTQDGEIYEFPKVSVSNTRYTSIDPEGPITDKFSQVLDFTMEELAETMDTMLHPLKQIEEMGSGDKCGDNETLIYQIYQLILSLSLVPYRWNMYDFRLYGKSRDQIREMNLKTDESKKINSQLSIYGIIRTLFLKRLESSVHALESSLKRYLERIQIFEEVLMNKNLIINLSDIDDIVDEYGYNDGEQVNYNQEELLDLAKKNPQDIDENINKEALLEDIGLEKALVGEIIDVLDKYEDKDTKIEDLKNKLKQQHAADPESKLLVFSFFSDTINYIKDKIESDPEMQSIFEVSAFVSGDHKESALNAADRFSPKARGKAALSENEGELTYLFSTDVLSEGQNLQDCGIILNYDLHWNPVRMVQRNGRINRLGSEFNEVKIENYIPGTQLESYLGLMDRINNKIELIKHAIGNDSSIFGEDIDARSYTDLYSENDKVATEKYQELESELETLSEDVFLNDLKVFYEEASEEEIRRMERIPYKSWGIVPDGFSDMETLTLARFEYDDSSKREVFFGNDKEANSLEMVQNIVALNMIRTSDYEKRVDTIQIDKERHLDVSINLGSQIAENTQNDRSLTPTQEQALGEAHSHGWTAEEIDRLRTTLTTRNVLLQKKVRRIVLSINSSLKNNEPIDHYYDDLRELLIDDVEEGPEIVKGTPLFGYTDQFDK
jgi:ERCC4-related helicase